jgi:drug/metabolite transporter (DMT)-like permease
MPLFYYLRYRDVKKYGGVEKLPSYIKAKKEGLKMNPSRFWMIIPAVFDLMGSTLLFVSLTMISASVYQMLKGALVFIAAIYSIIFLKRRFFRHHWTALTIVIIGVIIVGASPIIYPDSSSSQQDDDIR